MSKRKEKEMTLPPEKATVTLTVTLVNELLNYLSNKPYLEVVGLISNIQQEAQEKKQLTNVKL